MAGGVWPQKRKILIQHESWRERDIGAGGRRFLKQLLQSLLPNEKLDDEPATQNTPKQARAALVGS